VASSSATSISRKYPVARADVSDLQGYSSENRSRLEALPRSPLRRG
jgi:hypothetical protein